MNTTIVTLFRNTISFTPNHKLLYLFRIKILYILLKIVQSNLISTLILLIVYLNQKAMIIKNEINVEYHRTYLIASYNY